ncbi:MAG: GIY-YIG nuclease family protein [Bacteroidales bacterium]|nr:GIY-YIG nuclease family protein [Bacteroidales bacterium]
MQSYAYIMTNKWHTVLYVGCTNNLMRRISEHKHHKYKGSFTDKYNCEYCIYYEEYNTYREAIKRENKIKNMSRAEKEQLISNKNPDWQEVATEYGFIHTRKSFVDEVASVLKSLQTKESPLQQRCGMEDANHANE